MFDWYCEIRGELAVATEAFHPTVLNVAYVEFRDHQALQVVYMVNPWYIVVFNKYVKLKGPDI